MRIVILGTGDVGGKPGTKFVSPGNDARMGSQTATNPKAAGTTKASGSEMMLPVWVRLMGAIQTSNFNFKIAK